jgi:hypothetical protein
LVPITAAKPKQRFFHQSFPPIAMTGEAYNDWERLSIVSPMILLAYKVFIVSFLCNRTFRVCGAHDSCLMEKFFRFAPFFDKNMSEISV